MLTKLNPWLVGWLNSAAESAGSTQVVKRAPSTAGEGRRLWELAGEEDGSHGGYVYEGYDGFYHLLPALKYHELDAAELVKECERRVEEHRRSVERAERRQSLIRAFAGVALFVLWAIAAMWLFEP